MSTLIYNPIDIRTPEGRWINSSIFKEEALKFERNGYYCPHVPGTKAYKVYWDEQLRRCIEGYEVAGHKITGHHYNYLNFTKIMVVIGDPEDPNAKKDFKFPDFWDGDFDYYWCIEIAKNGVDTKSALLTTPEQKTKLKSLPLEERKKERVKIVEALKMKVIPHPDWLDGGHHFIVGKARRKGFQQPYSEIIITPSGETTMGDIRVGDYVSTPDGNNALVLEKFEQGIEDVYEITLQDGRKVRCGLDHLWQIEEFRGYKKIVNTAFFLDKKLKRGIKGKEYYSYFIPQTKEVRYNETGKLPIDPYLLGLLIGDGSLTRGSCLFSTVDSELLYHIQNIIEDKYTINKKTDTQYSIVYKDKVNNINPLLRELRKLNLLKLAKNKFIPDIYKYASIESRYELIRGLMDTDGSSWISGSCNFVNTSEKLIDDLQYVLRSLGIRVKKSKCNNLGKGFSKSQAWTLIITTDKPIFKLRRKLHRLRKRAYNINKIAITGVRKLDYQEKSACILLDSKDHLYLTKDFVVTHNSYKNGAICANVYNTIRKSVTLIGAFDKKYLYPKGTMAMASDYLTLFNQNTAWGKAREYVDKQEHRKASFSKTINGVPIEAGYQSEIIAISFGDNADASRGKDPLYVLFEEAGKFPNLLESYNATKPSLGAGIYITGQMLVFGTGGDMKSGTVDFADMFYHPMEHNLMPFLNIWDENANGSYCGFFHPIYMNMEGHYDLQGNSDITEATKAEEDAREKIKKVASSSKVLQSRVQENPLCPAEAFLTVSINDFPTIELRNRYNQVIRENLHIKRGQPVHLSKEGEPIKEEIKAEDGTVSYRLRHRIKVEPDLSGQIEPIWEYKLKSVKSKDLRGGVVIYEYPVSNSPKGLYKIGFDPYMQDQSTSTTPSLAAIYVYKGAHKFSFGRHKIVAQYVGRPYSPDDVNRIAEMLAELYNTEIMYENMVPHVKGFFERRKKLHLLAAQPDAVISKNIKKSTVARIYGCHMNDQLKDAGEKYIKEWLLTERDFDEEGNAVYNLDMIDDPALLEELIFYNRKGNFDRVMAFMMVMIQSAEEEESKVHGDGKTNANVADLLALMDSQFKK